MYRKLIAYLFLILPQATLADVGVALGINVTYDFQVGISVKVLSSDKMDEFVVAAGTSYYPFSEHKIGVNLGLGKTAELNTFWLYGIDIYKDASYMSAGFFNSHSQKE